MYRSLAALLLLAWVGPALAQETVIREPDRVVHRARTTVEFSEVPVDGTLARPEGSMVVVAPRSRFACLVKRRADFLPELQRSTDQL